jgi:hypothetical protein
MQKAAIKLGARVRIAPQHWLRGYEEGRIIDHQLHLTNAWLVKFDRAFPGGGIEGDKLWLNESHFVDILSSAADSVPTAVAQAESASSTARFQPRCSVLKTATLPY